MITLDLSEAIAGCEQIQRRKSSPLDFLLSPLSTRHSPLATIPTMITLDLADAVLTSERRAMSSSSMTRKRNMLKFNLDDVARFAARMKRLDLTRGDVTPLLENWERQMEEGNRKGVLAGTDGAGHPMIAVTYRPAGQVRKKLTLGERLGQRPNSRRGVYGGIGPARGGLLANNNLTSRAYRQLDGPPLAPRRQFSRAIANAVTGNYPDVTRRGVYYVELAWGEVASPKGFHFLPVHFEGKPLGKHGPSIKRDLRGIRPGTRESMLKALRAWCMLTIRAKAFLENLGAA